MHGIIAALHQQRQRLAAEYMAMPTGASERATQSIILLFDYSASTNVDVWYGGHASESVVSIRTRSHLIAPSAA
jgi:hypothetical protein